MSHHRMLAYEMSQKLHEEDLREIHGAGWTRAVCVEVYHNKGRPPYGAGVDVQVDL